MRSRSRFTSGDDKTIIPFPVKKILFLLLICSCSSLPPDDKQKHLLLQNNIYTSRVLLDGQTTHDLMMNNAYKLSLNDSTMRDNYHRCVSLWKSTREIQDTIRHLISRLIVAADNLPPLVADTIKLEKLQHPMEIDALRPVLFGKSNRDSLSCAARQVHDLLEEKSEQLSSILPNFHAHSRYKAPESSKKGISWEHDAFDNQPLLADIVLLRQLLLEVVNADNKVIAEISNEMIHVKLN